ncbi:hypothetical protein HN375_02360 [bacterium]|jgi:hypothetical protein|nr:hypothetical protein [bacterium]MBT3729877.1 hypothetical protein [bacterium]
MSNANQQLLDEFFKLQIDQNEVILEVTSSKQLLQFWNDGMERSMHNRDKHNGYWDADFALKNKRKLESEVDKAQKKFDTNQERLRELQDKVLVIMTMPC